MNLYGLPAQDLIGKYCYEVFCQHRSGCEDCHVREVFQTGSIRRHERVIDLTDGQRRYFVPHCYPVRDDAGQVIQAVEHSREITEPRKVEDQLRVSEERYRTLVEDIGEILGVWSTFLARGWSVASAWAM